MKEDVKTAVKGMEFWPYLAKKLPAHFTWGVKVKLADLISWGKVSCRHK
jgi:hypothetical protein